MSDNRPIGVFDSGLGGLTVVKEIARLMPSEKVIYLGDTARVPYGTRSDEIITQFGVEDALFLLGFDIKMIVVACNTVSSVALDAIRSKVREIPVIGVVLPGCKAAVTRTAVKKIGVIGTTATIRTNAYNKGINALDPTIRVFGKACPLFVPLAEEGLVNHDITQAVVQYYLYEMVDIGIDCLILGCTHYPLLLEVIQDTVSNRIELLDSAMWTAFEIQNILEALDGQAQQSVKGLWESEFYITDYTPHFETNAQRFLGTELRTLKRVSIEQLTHISQGK